MEIQEFAEQVVFGTTLAEKLTDPGELSDHKSEYSIPPTALPGRPKGLELHRLENAPKPPQHLHTENDRGALLHFLANHELLATELMALVLLRFPNAPKEFRAGVLDTLKEEQAHTRMYLNRMEKCGVQFGEIPLSGYFWRMVAPMESPMDFVSRLSLTFEQANLDYSRFYATRFAEAGDRETAAILEAIYHDEIGHVGHGLKWFRKWKSQSESDWDAYRKILHFPLSPVRAKANVGEFNREGRFAAGLSKEFVDALSLFRQSRGRSPDVFWFNPNAEEELSQREHSKTAATIASDLEGLMLFLAKHEDVVLLRNEVKPFFLKQLENAGFELPEILPMPVSGHPLTKRKTAGLHPWAWTPFAIDQASHLKPSLDISWAPNRETLYKKSWANNLLASLLPSRPSWVGGEETLGIVVTDLHALQDALGVLSERGIQTVRVKPDLGTAGRGQRRMPANSALHAADKEYVKKLLAHGAVLLEPQLDRRIDISLQWTMHAGKLKFLDWTHPVTTEGGRFAGTYIGKPFSTCPKNLKSFLLSNRHEKLHALVSWLTVPLQQILQEFQHEGNLGIDAMVYAEANGTLKIKPIVEINPRTTMGHIALALQDHLARGIAAKFSLLTAHQIKRTTGGTFNQYVETMHKAHELQLDKDGKITEGQLALCDPSNAQSLLPVLTAGNSLNAAPLESLK